MAAYLAGWETVPIGSTTKDRAALTVRAAPATVRARRRPWLLVRWWRWCWRVARCRRAMTVVRIARSVRVPAQVGGSSWWVVKEVERAQGEQAAAVHPGPVGDAGGEGFDDDDRRGEGPDHVAGDVVDQWMGGEPGAGDEGVGAVVVVRGVSGDVRVEQALVDQSGLGESERGGEGDEGERSAAAAADRFADEDGDGAVERDEEQQAGEKVEGTSDAGVVADEVFAAGRGEDEQPGGGGEACPSGRWGAGRRVGWRGRRCGWRWGGGVHGGWRGGDQMRVRVRRVPLSAARHRAVPARTMRA